MFNEISVKNSHKFNCESCDYKCSKKSNWDKHITTSKHTFRTSVLNNNQHSKPKINECQLCDYKCIKPSEWNKHLATAKHHFRTNVLNCSKKWKKISLQQKDHKSSDIFAINEQIEKYAQDKKCNDTYQTEKYIIENITNHTASQSNEEMEEHNDKKRIQNLHNIFAKIATKYILHETVFGITNNVVLRKKLIQIIMKF